MSLAIETIPKFINIIKKKFSYIERKAIILTLFENNCNMDSLTDEVVRYFRSNGKGCERFDKGIVNKSILLISGNKYVLICKKISIGKTLSSVHRIILVPLE
jgi:hypothetical protein